MERVSKHEIEQASMRIRRGWAATVRQTLAGPRHLVSCRRLISRMVVSFNSFPVGIFSEESQQLHHVPRCVAFNRRLESS